MVNHENIASYEKGREYSREIHDQIEIVNNAIQALDSREHTKLEKFEQIAPGTTPDRDSILELKRELDWCVNELYESHTEERRIIKHFLKAQQLCIDCLEKVYEE